jgi:hypothetical protein
LLEHLTPAQCLDPVPDLQRGKNYRAGQRGELSFAQRARVAIWKDDRSFRAPDIAADMKFVDCANNVDG